MELTPKNIAIIAVIAVIAVAIVKRIGTLNKIVGL